MGKLINKLRSLPVHWKLLFFGQGVITIFLINHRLNLIQEHKNRIEKEKNEATNN